MQRSLRTLFAYAVLSAMQLAQAAETELFWGDTHLHSSNSFDAFLRENRTADPDTAYRYAKGLPVIHPYHRARVRIDTPLDFLVVADHAEYLGLARKAYEGGPDVTRTPAGEMLRQRVDAGRGFEVFAAVLPRGRDATGFNRPVFVENGDELSATVWANATAIADRHNDPGRFTTLIGWEWSSLPGGANLHRVVFTSTDGATARKFMPFSALESNRPEDLWDWLDRTSAALDIDFVSIPHNSNISKGLMFADTDSDGHTLTAGYARTRSRWETVTEVTQIKGDSETHAEFSPNDEFASFEEFTNYIQQVPEPYVAHIGDFIRPALRRGLEFARVFGVNPYQFGLIGSTDAHTGLASAEEPNFWGKMGIDSTPETKTKFSPRPSLTGWNMSAAGLAAVWATENSRAAILDAFKRKEVYATTGPRIKVRFFGGWGFRRRHLKDKDFTNVGYRRGVPMGGELTSPPGDQAPSFLIRAQRDVRGANLDRIQIVKGWLDAEGDSQEKVFDVAWSGDRRQGSNGRIPAVGNTVDLKTGNTRNDIGAAELAAVWTDPGFDASKHAFYYVRVLQIPTARHSLYDAIALGKENIDGFPATIQERAYTSPIWFTPDE